MNRRMRIGLVKPCCIGDVVLTTPLLSALRRGYPDAAINWIIGSAAITAIRNHPALQRVIDSGPLANPASKPESFLKLVRVLRSGKYDLLVVPDRSPLMSLAALSSGVRQRAGLDSAGRGFGYTAKAPIKPAEVRHEAEIYLDIARALRLDTADCWANIPPSVQALEAAKTALKNAGADSRSLIVVHPGGGVNAGMVMVEKRWPADRFVALAEQIVSTIGGQVALIGVKSDQDAISAFKAAWKRPLIDLTERLSLPATGALASLAALYVGNDNGVAHLAAASGGKVLMIFGPSDPRRYAPFVPPDRARVAWRPAALPERGVSAGTPVDFDWTRDGVSVDEAWEQARQLI